MRAVITPISIVYHLHDQYFAFTNYILNEWINFSFNKALHFKKPLKDFKFNLLFKGQTL